ncbi:MAG: 23S rRNA (guanosine(2251)-2'-O)-methyltransferase RlmB [Eubacteriaceae bacterium]|nr:23S rRNA (guanosine(2251)-2'-O)-methyltransferase RlmB [Eubacteriaceae bacterium]
MNSKEETREKEYAKVMGRNPVKEALKSGRNINKIYVSSTDSDYSMSQIINTAKDMGIYVQKTDRRKLDAMTGNGAHQGVVAICSPIEFVGVDDILEAARQKGEKPFIVMLDGITDIHNAGAIIRSAYCAGAHGIIIAKRRSAAINDGIYKTSAGSVEYIPIAQVSNLAQTMQSLQKQGIFCVCCDMKGTVYHEIDYDMPLMIIAGAEGEGISRVIKDKCDFCASIPMKGQLDSLNTSVAAGIVIFEAARQRG